MSLREFSRAFNERFGMGVKLYINNVRVRKAVDLLNKSPNVSNYEYSNIRGLWNLTHFERVFRKIYGVSTGDYRRERSG